MNVLRFIDVYTTFTLTRYTGNFNRFEKRNGVKSKECTAVNAQKVEFLYRIGRLVLRSCLGNIANFFLSLQRCEILHKYAPPIRTSENWRAGEWSIRGRENMYIEVGQ